ncbi:hypothetical protein [Williamsia sterculiae]|uniref:Uncharacterized protein n=1 Tax=Williamsia sterculiae TaxID=1344003 RepID=A0A1N7H159_9NOCA|nr:hypothetical protein [Williamsia sterculiae]SIS18561.1 hypothetical protein SAMN05445060_3351 [Williamsia sterculiae]
MGDYQNNPGQQVVWDDDDSKLVISDNGSRADYYEGATHSYSTYNKDGDVTTLGVGETHEH